MPPNSPSPEDWLAALPARPVAPEQGECCQGDCGSSCVFAVYERELERWQDRVDALRQEPPRPGGS